MIESGVVVGRIASAGAVGNWFHALALLHGAFHQLTAGVDCALHRLAVRLGGQVGNKVLRDSKFGQFRRGAKALGLGQFHGGLAFDAEGVNFLFETGEFANQFGFGHILFLFFLFGHRGRGFAVAGRGLIPDLFLVAGVDAIGLGLGNRAFVATNPVNFAFKVCHRVGAIGRGRAMFHQGFHEDFDQSLIVGGRAVQEFGNGAHDVGFVVALGGCASAVRCHHGGPVLAATSHHGVGVAGHRLEQFPHGGGVGGFRFGDLVFE